MSRCLNAILDMQTGQEPKCGALGLPLCEVCRGTTAEESDHALVLVHNEALLAEIASLKSQKSEMATLYGASLKQADAALQKAEGERDAMREALTKCRTETLEEAALAVEDADNHYPGDYEHGSCFSADRLAETIRALKGKTNE